MLVALGGLGLATAGTEVEMEVIVSVIMKRKKENTLEFYI